MSLETSRDTAIGDWDFSAIQDHQIVPDPGSQNPFTPGVALDAEPRSYTVDVVPNGLSWSTVNRLDLPNDGGTGRITLRVVAPNEGVTLTEHDLPTIQALDAITGLPTACPDNPAFILPDLVDGAGGSGTSAVVENIDSLDIEDLALGLFRLKVRERFWVFLFEIAYIPFDGSSAIPGYLHGMTRITPGNVGLVKFKAPTFLNTYPGTGTFSLNADMRYWSLCVLDLEQGESLACLPDYLARIDRMGFVKIAFAPPGGAVETTAKNRGYNFLPDLREPTKEESRKMMVFVYRQVLPSEAFMSAHFNQGDYLPQGRICPPLLFLAGICGIR